MSVPVACGGEVTKLSPQKKPWNPHEHWRAGVILGSQNAQFDFQIVGPYMDVSRKASIGGVKV